MPWMRPHGARLWQPKISQSGQPRATRLLAPAIEESVGVNDQLLPGVLTVMPRRRHLPEAGHAVGPGRDRLGGRCRAWSWRTRRRFPE